MKLVDMLARAVLSASFDAIVAADSKGIIVFWNPGAERIFGHARADAVGQSLDIIIPERLRKRHWEGYDRVMSGGESRYGHGDVLAVPGIRKDGTRISIEFTIVPLLDETDELVGLAAVMRDVTTRFEELKGLRAKAREGGASSDGPARRTCHIDSGSTADMTEITPPRANDLRTGSTDHDWPTVVDDMPRSEHAEASRGTLAEQRLVALGQMTGGIAHDFRNVLATVGAALRLAESYPDAPERRRIFIAEARDGISRGLRVTSQLLNFAKQQERGLHAVDINEALGTLELFLKYGAGSKARVVLDLGSKLPSSVLDPSQFSAAILNLVLNARDAMPDGGDVVISTRRCAVKSQSAGSPPPGDYVCVRVSDSGVGMSADVIRQIFEPFFTTKGESGTGLGIPQVCAFMRQVGGHISVSSKQNSGTNIDLFFPAAERAVQRNVAKVAR